MNRRDFLSLVGSGAALLATGCSKESPLPDDPPKYNVLLVTLDTTRTEHLSCYGYKVLTSPNLDQLTSQSIKFDRAIVTSGSTPMSHASILTGLNPYQHGIRVMYAASGYCMPDSVPTLATVLREVGWQTAAFLSSFSVSEFYGLQNGFDTFDNGITGPVDEKMKRVQDVWGWNTAQDQRRSDGTTESAIKWLSPSPQ